MKPDFLMTATLLGLMLSLGQPTISAKEEQFALASASRPAVRIERVEQISSHHAIAFGPELVCRVQHAIRWLDEPWTKEQCFARAMDFAGEADHWNLDPLMLFALAIHESTLQPKAFHQDNGAVDVGLMGVRCRLGNNGKCTNLPVKGLTPAKLMEPSRNIQAGVWILVNLHKGDLASYNGGPHPRDSSHYLEKNSAILSALGGINVLAKHRRHGKETWMEKLTRMITQAVE